MAHRWAGIAAMLPTFLRKLVVLSWASRALMADRVPVYLLAGLQGGVALRGIAVLSAGLACLLNTW